MFELKQKHIFVTGGTGFFGKSILSMLCRGYLPETQFTILSRRPDRFLQQCPEFDQLNQVRFIAGDVRDFSFPEEHFDAIVHAATPASTRLAPGEVRSIIMDGTKRVIEFAKRCGAERLLTTSSGAVYGVQPPDLERISESFPCQPVTEYGIAKLDSEKMCVDSGLDAILLRCFAFVGPYLNRDSHYAMGNFLRDVLANQPIVIHEDGTPLRSYLYADDLVEWLFTLLAQGEKGVPYNVGSDEAISIQDLARRIKSVLKSNLPLVIERTPISGTPANRYVPDIARAKLLGLTVKTSLDNAIKNSV